MKLYKVLKDGKSKDGGCFDYNPYLPKGKIEGKWLPIIKNLEICSNGYHLTSNYKNWLDNGNQVWLVEVKPEQDLSLKEDDKYCVNTFRFVKLIETNTGKGNTGLCNSGYKNSGDYNSGNKNSGYSNSGYKNSGDYNSGNKNSGYKNSGYCNSRNYNSGDYNSGDYNSGDYNSGDWNCCNYETGFFNTKQSKYVNVFNKKCLRTKWEKAKKPEFLYFDLTEWVEYTEEEKKEDKKKELIGGYLKTFDYKTAFIKSFNNASKEDVELLLKLPNFNYNVFENLSGISKKMIEEKLK